MLLLCRRTPKSIHIHSYTTHTQENTQKLPPNKRRQKIPRNYTPTEGKPHQIELARLGQTGGRPPEVDGVAVKLAVLAGGPPAQLPVLRDLQPAHKGVVGADASDFSARVTTKRPTAMQEDERHVTGRVAFVEAGARPRRCFCSSPPFLSSEQQYKAHTTHPPSLAVLSVPLLCSRRVQ